MTIWCDVEDLYEYARSVTRPSGIQRLSYEMYAALHALDPDGVRFVRMNARSGTMRVVAWQDVASVFHGMAGALPAAVGPVRVVTPPSLTHSALARAPGLRAAAQRMPRALRQPLGEAIRGQVVVLRNLALAARAIPAALAAQRPSGARLATAPVRGVDLREAARPGDILASLGSPWSLPDYPNCVDRMRREAKLRYVMLIYDLIPAMRPEYCDRAQVVMFDRFAHGCLPQADALLVISEATARDVGAWAAREGIPLRDRPRTIPIGTGFSHAAPAATLPAGLAPGGYALFVSTIEARKNHALAFRAWRRLLDELGPERVPTLVFAGRIGWMVADLLQQISNAGHLGGKLIIVENPDDATLAALYQGARFTLFPSLYEGWGLPVSESLAFGKVCLAASTTSVPEAGGDFCLYHDPDSVTEAVALYRRAIMEPELIPGLEARIRAEYRLTPWSATARAVLDALG
jgi:glycosyltransferase involved in cell wall biosynthesis